MRFGILGPLEVWTDTGETVTVSGPKPRALLVLLALHAGHSVSLDQLIDGQYGPQPPEGAANAVQAQVSRLRRSLGAEHIEFGPGGYRLAADPETVDAQQFAALARQGRHQLNAGRPAEAATALRQGLDLWRGPALADLPEAHAQAAGLEEQRLAATEDLFEAQLALPGGPSLDELAAATGAHPRRERLAGQYLRALHTAGRRAEALAHYDRLRRRLSDELGIDPSPELAQIHLAILRADQAAPPARQGLAAQLTSFVGRDAELSRLRELNQARLVTILGPGGTGKTRLAIESARRRDTPPCFVDLSGIEGGEQVPHTVLTATGLRDSGFRLETAVADPTTRLVEALRDQSLLLVIDNCEHVIASAAALVRTLLAECPSLSVIATSREPLGLTGETLVPLATLDIPDPDTPTAQALGYPAIRLFADRAAAVRPGFTVTDADAPTVINICAALDGLPLAIELAAARLRQFTLPQLADRLAAHGPFRLLSRGDRTAAARHRTLRAAVEWSWDLLEYQERELARRFAVFTGGATAAAVEAVTGDPDTEDLLADLVDKSLVTVDGGRYRMLDSIRLLCLEYLDEAGERETMRHKHTRYYLDLADQADPHLRRAEQLDWLAVLSADHANLMAALRWAADHDRPAGFRLIAALSAYLWFSGRSSQVGPIAAQLLTDVPEDSTEEYISCVVHASPRADTHHWERAGQAMRQAAATLRYPFGAALWGMAVGPWAPAEAYQPLGADEWNLALGQLSIGLVTTLNGRPGEGESELTAVLESFQHLGERWGTGQALDWLAETAGWRGEWRRAYDLRSQALARFTELGALEEAADVLVRRARCLARQGEYESASEDYQRAGQLASQTGRPGVPAVVSFGLGEIAAAGGDLTQAGRLFDAALAAAQGGDFGTEAVKAAALTALARLAERAGDTARARRLHREALESARPLVLASDLAEVAEGQSGAALLAGEAERAGLLLGAAVALRGTTVTGQVEVARIAEGVSELLGPAGFAKTYAAGVKLTREAALAELYAEPQTGSSSVPSDLSTLPSYPQARRRLQVGLSGGRLHSPQGGGIGNPHAVCRSMNEMDSCAAQGFSAILAGSSGSLQCVHIMSPAVTG